MAIYKKGADPVALRSAAERITAHARECDAVRGEAARAMGALRGSWGGGDLDTLMTRWAPVDAQLGQFGTDLGALAETLLRNAGQQDATSGPGGGAPGVPLASSPAPGHPGAPWVGGPPGHDGASSDGRTWHEELFGSGWMTGANAAMNFTGLLGSGLGLVGHYRQLDEFTFASNMLGGSNWKTLFQAGMSAEELGTGMSRFASSMGVVGKAVGPLGAAMSWGTFASDVASENYDRAAYDGVMATLGTAALLPIPPANLICGGVAAAMGVGQLIYDNNEAFQDFVDGGVDVVGDAAGAVADTAGDVLDAVTPDVDWPW